MTEAEKGVKAISLYDNWCETDTEDTLEVYCYEQGRADGIREFARYLVIDGYIRYGFETDYLVNQFLKKEQNNDNR